MFLPFAMFRHRFMRRTVIETFHWTLIELLLQPLDETFRVSGEITAFRDELSDELVRVLDGALFP